MMRKIQITTRSGSLRDVKRGLEGIRPTGVEYSLRFQRTTSRYRGIEPTVLVALVGVAGTAVGSLVHGLLNIASRKQEGHLEISGQGWSVKVPANVTNDELERLIGLAQSQVIEKIEIV